MKVYWSLKSTPEFKHLPEAEANAIYWAWRKVMFKRIGFWLSIGVDVLFVIALLFIEIGLKYFISYFHSMPVMFSALVGIPIGSLVARLLVIHDLRMFMAEGHLKPLIDQK